MSDPDIRPHPMVVCPFHRACIVAWHARQQHGERSSAYRLAVAEMEKLRPPPAFCSTCGRPAHHTKPCEAPR